MSPSDLAPGLWVALLASGVAWGLRRWYDPVPGRMLALASLITLLFLGPVLFGGRTLTPLDRLGEAAPYLEASTKPAASHPLQRPLLSVTAPAQAQVRRALKAGEWPLWNPWAGAGTPLLGQEEAQVLQPLQIATLPLPLEPAAGATAALRLWLALVFAYLWLRRCRPGGAGGGEISTPAATLGAVSYGLGAFLIQWLGWPAANAAAWLPGVLYASLRCLRQGDPRDRGLLVAVAAGLALAGDLETAGYAFAFVLAAGLAELAALAPEARLRRLGPWLLALASGVALAAPVLHAQAEAGRDTFRYQLPAADTRREALQDPLGLVSWGSAERRRTWAADAGSRLIPQAAPRAFGDAFSGYRGPSHVHKDAGAFAGSLALLLALLSLVGLRRHPGVVAAGGAWILGLVVLARPPGLAELLETLPLFPPTANAHRFQIVMVAALAWLAALALERWRRGEGLFAGAFRRWVPGTAAAALAVLIAGLYLAHGPESARGSTWVWMGVQLATLAVAGLVLLRRPRPWSWALLTLAVILELAIFHRPAARGAEGPETFPTPQSVAFLQQGSLEDEDARFAALDGALVPDLATIYRLHDMRVAPAHTPVSYAQLTRPARDRLAGDGALDLASPMLDLLGVRWVLAPPGPARETSEIEVFGDAGGRILERPGAFSRWFYPETAELFQSGDWRTWTAAAEDFRHRSLVGKIPGGDTLWQASQAHPAPPRRTVLGPAREVLELDLPEPRLLSSSHFHNGGWRLLLDGRPLSPIYVNGPLLGAWVPEGRHRIDVLQRPRGFLPGLAIAAIGAALALALAAPRPDREVPGLSRESQS